MMISSEISTSLLKKEICGFLLFTDLHSEYSDGSEPTIPGEGATSIGINGPLGWNMHYDDYHTLKGLFD